MYLCLYLCLYLYLYLYLYLFLLVFIFLFVFVFSFVFFVFRFVFLFESVSVSFICKPEAFYCGDPHLSFTSSPLLLLLLLLSLLLVIHTLIGSYTLYIVQQTQPLYLFYSFNLEFKFGQDRSNWEHSHFSTLRKSSCIRLKSDPPLSLHFSIVFQDFQTTMHCKAPTQRSD